jgi:hypothetical protein
MIIMEIRKINFLLFVLALFSNQIVAQDEGLEISKKSLSEISEDTCHLILQSNIKKDSVVLRWAPDLAIVWKQQLEVGYILERAEIPRDTSDLAIVFERMSKTPIKPLPYDQWAKIFNAKDKYAAIAAQLMFTNTPFNASDIGEPENITDRVNDLKMRHSFSLLAADQDVRVAQASGLRFVDKSIVKGNAYLYRLYYAIPHPEIPCDTAILYVDTDDIAPLIQARTPLVNNQDGAITLQWNAGRNTSFSGYYVERADFGTEYFKRMNETPLVSFQKDGSIEDFCFFTDSVENYKKYHYRIVGINLFSELSIPSEKVLGMARDLTPPSPALILKADDLGNKTLRLEWQVPYVNPDLSHFEIARSYNVDGPFQSISNKLKAETCHYVDESPNPHKGSFYAIVSYDTAGNAAQSLPFYGILVDSFPPAIPVGLHGFIDTNSVVHLNWKLGKDPDLQGYRVFFANSPDDEFSNLTPYIWSDTIYKDTIAKRTLTKHIYYSIAAVDNNYNHSKMSPWVKIRRLDVIPPEPPILKNIEVQDSSVTLWWFNSNSDDVAEHILLRKNANEHEWAIAAKWLGYPNKQDYTDKNIAPKTYYEYAMIAIDSSNLKSELSPLLSIRTYDRGVRPSVDEFTVTYDEKLKANVIKWNYHVNNKLSFLIYRGYQNFGITKYVKINGSDRNFIDRHLVGKGEYTYAIKAVFEDGGESPVSEIVNVIIK